MLAAARGIMISDADTTEVVAQSCLLVPDCRLWVMRHTTPVSGVSPVPVRPR